MIKAVIFDMDGLMVETNPFTYQAYATVLQKYGKNLSEETYNEQYFGKSGSEKSTEIVVQYDLPLTPEAFYAEKQGVYYQLLAGGIQPKPGLLQLLKTLQQGNYHIAIASGSPLEEITHIIEGLQIGEFINVIASEEEVAHGKPAPDVFLLAAKRLDVEPNECLVLEDSPLGIWAAKEAGMLRYAIPSPQTKNERFLGANRVLLSLRDVASVLQQDHNYE